MATLIIMAGRPVAGRCAGEVRLMRLLPGSAAAIGQHRIGRVMQPGMPFRAHAGSIRRAGINHPAAGSRAAYRRALLIILIAETVGADMAALPQRHQDQAGIAKKPFYPAELGQSHF